MTIRTKLKPHNNTKLETFRKLKKNYIRLVFLVIEIRKKIQSMCQKIL